METLSRFAGPWPHQEMWWCVCAENDCEATLYGPFTSIEEAQAEADYNDGCTKHFAVRGEPRQKDKVYISEPCFSLDTIEASMWRRWRQSGIIE